jgi:RimJ/RimL family protein N-acetyltransferase
VARSHGVARVHALRVGVPRLTTRRLLLHPLTVDEARVVRTGEAPRGCRFGEGYPLPDTYDGLRLFLRHEDERYGFNLIVRREDGLVIGEIGFAGPPKDGAVTIGYAIVPSARRRGYATEAIVAVSRWALAEPDVAEVRAQTLPDNEASVRALVRAGFSEQAPGGNLRRFALSGD